MSDTFDHEGDAWDSLNDDCGIDDVVEYMARQGWNGPRSKVYGPPLKCNRCGSVNVYWQSCVGQHQLFSTLTAEPHVCAISTGNFEVIPE